MTRAGTQLLWAIPLAMGLASCDNERPIARARILDANGSRLPSGSIIDTQSMVTMVTLDGSESSDADGRVRSYQWLEVTDPADITVNSAYEQLDFFARPTASFVVFPGQHTYDLRVFDDDGAASEFDRIVFTLRLSLPAAPATVRARALGAAGASAFPAR